MKSPLQKLALIVSLSLVVFSCGQKQESKNEEIEFEIENKEIPAEARAEKAAHDEVMRVHDEAMRELEKIMSVKGKLQEQLDLLRENEDTTDTKNLEEAIVALEKADEAMMQWMRDFNAQDYDSAAHEEILNYYKEQQILIADVHEQMKEAIAEGEKLIEQE